MTIHPVLLDPEAVLVLQVPVDDPPSSASFRAAGRLAVEALGLGLSGERVVLKPNVTIGEKLADPDSGITTHPAFVHGLIDGIQERAADGARLPPVAILEDPRNSDDDTPRDWRNTGYPEVADASGAELVCPTTDTCTRVNVPSPLALPSIPVSTLAVAPDALLINVPKLKTHNLAITTLCMKNLMGAVYAANRHYCSQSWREMPEALEHGGRAKREWMDEATHRRWQEGLARRLVDTARVVTPHLNIVEGIVGREGTGFQRGRNRSLGLVVTGVNMVAVDAAASYLMGFDPERIVYLEMAASAGLGPTRIADLTFYTSADGRLALCDNIEPYRANPPFRVISDILGEPAAVFDDGGARSVTGRTGGVFRL